MHAGAIEGRPEFECAAVCDTDPGRRDQAVSRFGCPVYDDYHAMLEAGGLDLVVIVTRSHQHCRMTCDCLEAGVGVLVTKPWATTAAEAESMVEAAARSRQPLLPWLPARWGADLARLRQLVRDGIVGRVFLVRRAVTSFGTRCDWQTERRYGGGYLLNWGPHIIDPAMLLAGGRPASVYAFTRQTINPGDTEDVFLAIITMQDGTVVHAEYTVAVEPLPSWFVQGDRGTLVVRDRALSVQQHTPARPDDPTRFATMKPSEETTQNETLDGAVYGDEHAIYGDVALALTGKRPFPVTPADALSLSRVTDAVRTSARENKVVAL
jgi:predicted dehydrogenase